MKRQSFNIVLESELAVGLPGSIHGRRDSMDYLSGSMLLGAVAAQLYSALGKAAWPVFHTGKVRFGDGLPLSPFGLPTVPMPRCFLVPKKAGTADRQEPGIWRNALYEPRTPDWEEPNRPYLSTAGEGVQPRSHYRLKTAVDPRSGVAKDRQLYGYHGLAAGQTYHSVLEADDDVPQEVFDQLVAALTGTLRLGRSRYSEYGRCRLVPVPTESVDSAVVTEGMLTVLLLSDLIIEDCYGVPCSVPRSEDLGLPPATAVNARCFVRHGKHRCYNGAYRAYEGDFTLIKRGSVLTYQLEQMDKAVSTDSIRCVGLFRQRGFGRLWLNPPFLCTAKPEFVDAPEKQEAKVPPKPDLPLAQWLADCQAARHEEDVVRHEAEVWHLELLRLLDAASVRGGLASHIAVGPSPSQWGRISEAVASECAGTMDTARLHTALFNEKTGICKEGDPQWDTTILHDALEKRLGGPPTFRSWLRAKLEGDAAVQTDRESKLSQHRRIAVLGHFARVAADRAKEQRSRTEEAL